MQALLAAYKYRILFDWLISLGEGKNDPDRAKIYQKAWKAKQQLASMHDTVFSPMHMSPSVSVARVFLEGLLYVFFVAMAIAIPTSFGFAIGMFVPIGLILLAAGIYAAAISESFRGILLDIFYNLCSDISIFPFFQVTYALLAIGIVISAFLLPPLALGLLLFALVIVVTCSFHPTPAKMQAVTASMPTTLGEPSTLDQSTNANSNANSYTQTLRSTTNSPNERTPLLAKPEQHEVRDDSRREPIAQTPTPEQQRVTP